MASDALKAPPLSAEPQEYVDWLEFSAFFAVRKLARVDELMGLLFIQAEEGEDAIAEQDASEERLRELIENEIRLRSESLGDAYPFVLDEEGEELSIKSREERHAAALYLVCLILSHVTRSGILERPPADAAVRDVRRRHFQVFSTLAIAGYANGPSVSLGWPRPTGGSILSVVARGCQLSQVGLARAAPATTAPPAAKDGGLDVLAWTPANDGPPPTQFIFGQAASGHNWPGKSSRDEAEDFLESYYEENPNCNYGYVTICPFRLPDELKMQRSRRHGAILDRARAPLHALNGWQLGMTGTHVEETAGLGPLTLWISRYRNANLAA